MSTDSGRLRLGVIGSGIMGTNHARVASAMSELDLVAVYDADRNRSENLATGFGATAAADIAELAGMVDAAVVATPTEFHAPIAHQLIEAGVDVLVEKPIAPDVETAQRLVDAAEAAGRVLMVGHVERFNPAVLELGSLLDDVIHIDARRISSYSPRIRDDVVIDLMIHDLDLVTMIAGGAAAEVMSVVRAPRSASADIASALVAFENGITASLTASRVGQNKIRQIDLTQAENYVTLDLLRQDVTVQRVQQSEFSSDHGRRYRQMGVVEVPFLEHRGEPLALELRHFAECVTNRATPRVTGQDGLRALDLALRVAAAPIR
ncbi:Gfo/Idh/MocA family protein [Blastococcus litoris]|uniref:Gfo/Idh/MocA family protein n=1 Tax=Blastococcus litoris TaxID=2171622 RepID=UPI0013DE906D|nr:Gfo/Idh/MocA family oxidoreductase [Blastococcus litoris]